MATKITVDLPDEVYQRAAEFARQHDQKMEDAIPALIEDGLAAQVTQGNGRAEVVSDPAIEREREAYIALHAQLKEQYMGKYVAIHHGQLIDHDDDPAVLAGRVYAQYPDEFVLVTQVRQAPIRTIVVRSPRIVRDKVL